MTILNSSQARSYSNAQQLVRFLKQNKHIHNTFTPFSDEVKSLLHNLDQIPALATTKKKKGTAITLQKKALKKELAADAAYLCNMVTVYALNTNNTTLKYKVRHTFTDIFTLKDYAVKIVVTVITNAILPLLSKEDFIPYGITQNDLTNITEKANQYDSMMFTAKFINRESDYASRNITTILKKIATHISRMKRLLPHFQHTHPAFITGFHEAMNTSQDSIHHNILEGTVTNTSTGEPVEGITITVKGKNKTAVTRSNGFYQLIGITTGTHTLTISAEGHTSQTITVKIIRGKTITLNITLEAVRLAKVPQVEVA